MSDKSQTTKPTFEQCSNLARRELPMTEEERAVYATGRPQITELCEWAPLPGRAAESGYDAYACLHPATVCVGADGRWHLCEACAALPWFKRLKKTPLKEVPHAI